MITTGYDPRRNRRVFGIAVAGSIAAHVLASLLALVASEQLARLLVHAPVHLPQRRQLDDEVVTLSSALRIEKRARPAPPQRARHAIAAARPSVQARASVPIPPRPPLVFRPNPLPTFAPPHATHELAAVERLAPAQPVRTMRAPAPEKVVADVPKRSAVTNAERASQLSDAQIEQIERDLSKSIARDRAEQTVESDVPRAVSPAATKRFVINMSGIGAGLHGYQGLCAPATAWQADGWDYYYLSCTIAHADGTVRSAVPVPWPVRFRPNADPWNSYGRTTDLPSSPIALPLPGWRPPPGRTIDPDIAQYLRQNGYAL
jgi:hypothetical protein